MKQVEISFFDKNGNVQYGLNWGNRDNRDPNEAYLQLTPEVYKGDFFPEKGTYFIVETDDHNTLIFNRAQKGIGTALQMPEDNALLGKYIRKRLGIKDGEEITTQNINDSGISAFVFTKVDRLHYKMRTNGKSNITSTVLPLDIAIKEIDARDVSYLRAMRTKPFLLLAGISGTGKSRIVKQMAFDSCPNNDVLRSDLTAPGNYCLIEVKPNWHDSTELLGYESQIGKPHYQLTPFVKFLAKAMLYPEVPFFVCLDEMNLAPVEQYFAEFLSVLESRTKIDGHIVSEPLIKASIFANAEYERDLKHEIFDVRIKEKDSNGLKIYEAELSPEESTAYERLKLHGLRIPENLIVVGTVNMDETTHQFSRKVIDRAMTIEMNLPEGDPFMDFFASGSELAYRENPMSPSLYLATVTKASAVVKALAEDNVEKTEWLKGEVAAFLANLNGALDGTPFKVAYRVQNELMLYFYQLWLEDKTADWGKILKTSCDQILMMKVLPRIEGDGELLETPLDELARFCEQYSNASNKITEMRKRLKKSQFTSFWP